jgi:hypothetical protein
MNEKNDKNKNDKNKNDKNKNEKNNNDEKNNDEVVEQNISFDAEFVNEVNAAVAGILNTNKRKDYLNRIDGAIIIPIYSRGMNSDQLTTGSVAIPDEAKKHDIYHIIKTIEAINDFSCKYATQYIHSLLNNNYQLGQQLATLQQKDKECQKS